MCKNCPKRANTKSGSRSVSAQGPGVDVKVRYLGGSGELLIYEGAATRTEYTVGGKINLITADSRDLATGISWAPGLLELSGPGGKLFEIHIPLKEEVEAEAEAEARKQEAREAAEALALKPKATVIEDTSIQTDVGIGDIKKPPRHKRKTKVKVPDGEGAVSGD